MGEEGRFDAEAFYQSLDAERLARRLNWKQVAAELWSQRLNADPDGAGQAPRRGRPSRAGSVVWPQRRRLRALWTRPGRSPSLASAKIATYLRLRPQLSRLEAATALEEMIKVTYERLAAVAYELIHDGVSEGVQDLGQADRRGDPARAWPWPSRSIDPLVLAEHLAIPVFDLSSLRAAAHRASIIC